MKANVSIVIPTWNGVELLKQFFLSVITAALRYAATTGSDIEIVLINDGSTDSTVDWLRSQEASNWGLGAASENQNLVIRWLTNETNLGFGRTVNRGMSEARHRLAFLLNNDVAVNENALAPLIKHFTDPAVFAVHCRVFDYATSKECGTGQLGSFARGSIRVHESYVTTEDQTALDNDERGRQPFYSMFASGGSAMYDRERFLGIGAFEGLLSPIYWEDVEISYRAWKRGYTVLYEPDSVVYHRVSSTMGRQNRRKIWRLQQRNRLIFHWINLHDTRMMLSHTLWVIVLTLTAPLRLQPLFMLAVFDALKLLPAIRQRRREEKSLAKRSDREVFQIFRNQRGKVERKK